MTKNNHRELWIVKFNRTLSIEYMAYETEEEAKDWAANNPKRATYLGKFVQQPTLGTIDCEKQTQD